MQTIIVGLIFLTAVFYIGRMFYHNFFKKEGGCASGCGKCNAVDFAKIESQIKDKGF